MGLDGDGSGAGLHKAGTSINESLLRQPVKCPLLPRPNSAKTLSPPHKYATEVVHDTIPESYLQLQAQAERTERQLEPEKEVSQSPEKPQAGPDPDNTGEKPLHKEVEQDVQQTSKPTSPSRESSVGKTDADAAKQQDARAAAVKRLKLGTDADWPDESQILDQIWREQDIFKATQLEWKIDNQVKLDVRGARKSAKDCVLTVEVDKEHTEGKFSNTDGITALNIISGPLQEVLRKVIAFDPSVNLYEDPISFAKPFSVLFHYMPGLEEYAQRSDPDDVGAKDLRVLLYICNKVFPRLFGSIRRCLAAGEVFYEALKALYRPGALLLATDYFEQSHVFMCVSAGWESAQYADCSSMEFIVRAWHIQWDHLFRRLRRRLAHFSLGQRIGTRKIKELPIYPLSYYGSEAVQQELKAKMIERNREWTQLVKRKASCWKHEGVALSDEGWKLINVRSKLRKFLLTSDD
jgi:hypothetical protein